MKSYIEILILQYDLVPDKASMVSGFAKWAFFLLRFDLILAQYLAKKGASLHLKNSRLTPGNQWIMEHYDTLDNSSRTEINPQPRKSLKSGRNWLLLASG